MSKDSAPPVRRFPLGRCGQGLHLGRAPPKSRGGHSPRGPAAAEQSRHPDVLVNRLHRAWPHQQLASSVNDRPKNGNITVKTIDRSFSPARHMAPETIRREPVDSTSTKNTQSLAMRCTSCARSCMLLQSAAIAIPAGLFGVERCRSENLTARSCRSP